MANNHWSCIMYVIFRCALTVKFSENNKRWTAAEVYFKLSKIDSLFRNSGPHILKEAPKSFPERFQWVPGSIPTWDFWQKASQNLSLPVSSYGISQNSLPTWMRTQTKRIKLDWSKVCKYEAYRNVTFLTRMDCNIGSFSVFTRRTNKKKRKNVPVTFRFFIIINHVCFDVFPYRSSHRYYIHFVIIHIILCVHWYALSLTQCFISVYYCLYISTKAFKPVDIQMYYGLSFPHLPSNFLWENIERER